MSTQNKIFLFDLDGTLSESRKSVQSDIASALRDLSNYGTIGIVSGSDFNFIKEQMEHSWEFIPCSKLIILPCNGTKRYDWNKQGRNSHFSITDELLMRAHVGEIDFAKLIQKILSLQAKFLETSPIIKNCTGHFVSYRGSMINWSPIGRDGDENDRSAFISYDKSSNFRKNHIKKIQNFCIKNNIDVKISLGGDTSFDLFPLGWDKTISLRFFNSEAVIYFFGDRCYPGGNDYELYEKVKLSGRAYSVGGPPETLQHIRDIIRSLK